MAQTKKKASKSLGKLSAKTFILSQILILCLGLLFLFGIYYILNIQYQKSNKLFSASGGPVTSAPASLRLELDTPEDNSLVFQPNLVVTGKTSPGADILIFTDTQNLVIKSNPDGSFSTILSLDQGINNVTAAVFDIAGNQRMEERTVYFSKDKI